MLGRTVALFQAVLLTLVFTPDAPSGTPLRTGPVDAHLTVTAHGHSRGESREVHLQEPAGGPSWGSEIAVHRVDGRRIEPVPTVTTRRGALFRTGEVASEPTLGVTGDGTIFFQLWDARGLGVVGRSRDGGRSWDHLSSSPLTDATGGSWDPYLYVDPATDRIFSVHLTGTLECHEVSFSDDAGATWTGSALCGELDHQTVFAGPPVTSVPAGYPNVVYVCAAQGPPGANFSWLTTCQKSLDGGVTFVPTGEPAYIGLDPEAEHGDFGLTGFCGGLTGHGVVGPDGTVYLPRTYCGRPSLAISRDEGATWQHVQVADNGTALTSYGQHEHDAGVAVDEDGNLYYTWIARDRLPYLSVSTDGGASWSEPLMVGAPDVVEASSPGAIDVGTPGRVAIAYLGSENSPGPPFFEVEDCTQEPLTCGTEGAREANGGTKTYIPEPSSYEHVTWNGYITAIVDVLGSPPRLYSAAVNDPDEPLIRGTCDPHRCKATLEFIDVVIGPRGVAWAAFADGCATGNCWGMLGEGVLGRLVGGPRLR